MTDDVHCSEESPSSKQSSERGKYAQFSSPNICVTNSLSLWIMFTVQKSKTERQICLNHTRGKLVFVFVFEHQFQNKAMTVREANWLKPHQGQTFPTSPVLRRPPSKSLSLWNFLHTADNDQLGHRFHKCDCPKRMCPIISYARSSQTTLTSIWVLGTHYVSVLFGLVLLFCV